MCIYDFENMFLFPSEKYLRLGFLYGIVSYVQLWKEFPKYSPSSYNSWDFHQKSIILIGSSVQFSLSVVSDSLWPHGPQQARPPCPSPTPGFYSNSCPLSQWCHPTISSSGIPFSSHLQSLPASESFQMSQFFASGGQSIGASASASVLPMNIQRWFPLG